MANERARSLRKNRTSAETRLWWQLRMLKAQGWKFRQQAPIDHFIVDFVCLSQRLIVEVDGGTHGSPDEMARDARRETLDEPPTPDSSPQGGGERPRPGSRPQVAALEGK